ncbi:hypothetical protein [Streptomyces sp. NPDC058457]|uniref:hypothetical protein n=1 Tax=Streptomyces sp. NPDC058457 TaxID=3346507 RepID=UPI00365B7174
MSLLVDGIGPIYTTRPTPRQLPIKAYAGSARDHMDVHQPAETALVGLIGFTPASSVCRRGLLAAQVAKLGRARG